MKTPIVKLKQLAVMTGIALSSIGGSGSVTPANALTFNFTPASGTSQQAIDGFAAAGTFWSSMFTDSVAVNINIGFTSLSGNTLAQAGSNGVLFNYSSVRSLLDANKTSVDDNTAVGSLSTNSTFKRLINNTTENSGTTYIDTVASGNNVSFSTANAKALGLAIPDSFYSGIYTDGLNKFDSVIEFNSNYAWDFDRSNGITSTEYDFVGVAIHEIGHSLGFYSEVDDLDTSGGTRSKNTFNTSTLDLFRYSAASGAQQAIDFTTGAGDKYFSLDGGITEIASFSNGATLGGDGRQASHWKDNLGLGIMDPTFASGELGVISQNDLRALDVIGWDRSAASYATSVPEPSNVVGTLMVAAFGAKMLLKRRKKLLEPTAKPTGEEA
jgi:hypothetical protein